MTVLYILWQNSVSREWLPVGQLRRVDGEYEFRYTKGANAQIGFVPFGRMGDLDAVYRSRTLFPLFANRVLSQSRPEYPAFLTWLDIDEDAGDPIKMLMRTGGTRATDGLLVYAKPQPNGAGRYETNFFCHGLRYAGDAAADRIASMQTGDLLMPLYDVLNRADPHAVAIRSDNPAILLGYVPRALAPDIRRCVDASAPDRVDFRVRKINREAPLQYRLLCRIETDWPSDFAPCAGENFQPRSDAVASNALEVAE